MARKLSNEEWAETERQDHRGRNRKVQMPPPPKPSLPWNAVLHLANVYEETVLERDAVVRDLKWTPYLQAIYGGWAPDSLDVNELDAYLQAVIYLAANERFTTGMSLAGESHYNKVVRAEPQHYKGGIIRSIYGRRIEIGEEVVLLKEGFHGKYAVVVGSEEGNHVFHYTVKFNGEPKLVATNELRPVNDP